MPDHVNRVTMLTDRAWYAVTRYIYISILFRLIVMPVGVTNLKIGRRGVATNLVGTPFVPTINKWLCCSCLFFYRWVIHRGNYYNYMFLFMRL